MGACGVDVSLQRKTLCTFRLEETQAESVSLMGSFNGWSTTANLMQYKNGGWEARVWLEPGKHEYCYFILEESCDSWGGLRSSLIQMGQRFNKIIELEVVSPPSDSSANKMLTI
ncbi:MAG TPA: glycogen-binding domain-containing protein [Tepidisphaeraceae bacterium]|jgi:hypothetical protein|nr:glycogen-binding domain-containing protein [Tepidisphaeraceae bacterium]